MKRLSKMCVSVVALTGVSAAVAPAAIVASNDIAVDIVVAGGAKSAAVAGPGSVVNLEIYGYVRDADGIPANTGLNGIQGTVRSGTGGILGDLAVTLAPAFSAFGSAVPAAADLDGDGDADVGPGADGNSNNLIFRAGTTGTWTDDLGTVTIDGVAFKKWLLGTATFTVRDGQDVAAAGETTIYFEPRTGSSLIRPQAYYFDSTSTLTTIQGTDSRFGTGDPVTVVPEPLGVGLVGMTMFLLGRRGSHGR